MQILIYLTYNRRTGTYYEPSKSENYVLERVFTCITISDRIYDRYITFNSIIKIFFKRFFPTSITHFPQQSKNSVGA